jgi:esterase/lipase/1-acyl-sn-glycerol-3-phosphate acyltransferase
MNRFAYRTTGVIIRSVSALSKLSAKLHGTDNIPPGPLIFVANHFTRLETLLLTYHTFYLTGHKPVWTLASADLFDTAIGEYLRQMGAVSTRDPNRDQLIIKSLLTGEASWIIYPEGRMMKNRHTLEKGRYVTWSPKGYRPPHSGAAALALRAEFYRQRLNIMADAKPAEYARLSSTFGIEPETHLDLDLPVHIVPINLSYYPVRARQRILELVPDKISEDLSPRVVEELMTEGSMLLSDTDIDIRFGRPIPLASYLKTKLVQNDITSPYPIDVDDPLPSLQAMRQTALNITQRCMGDIYAMTTVNPDHLLATLLDHHSRSAVQIDDFKRRTYWAIASLQSLHGIQRHRLLNTPPLQLLTGETLPWFDDFAETALTSGFIVKGRPSGWLKSADYSESAVDFHRVRVESPVTMMINEVKPLKNLQRHLRRISRTPAAWLRLRLEQVLPREAFSEFSRDYADFHIPEESKPPNIGAPRLYRRRSRRLGVVVIHGYMAAPAEVEPLARAIHRRGFWTCVPRIKGHGTAPEDLSLRNRMDWHRSVDRACAMALQRCRRVALVGFSNGAGLALHAAARIPATAVVVAICPPFKLKDYKVRLVPAVAMWDRLVTHVRGVTKSTFVENRPENPHINYSRNPVSGIHELESLMDEVYKMLPRLTIPTMIIQADQDPVVDLKGTRRAFERLGAKQREYLLLKRDRHVIVRGKDEKEIHDAAGYFIEKHCP